MINKSELKSIAKLSKLSVTDAELIDYFNDINYILDFAELNASVEQPYYNSNIISCNELREDDINVKQDGNYPSLSEYTDNSFYTVRGGNNDV